MNEEPPCVVFETTMGTIEFELYWKHAPKTCRNFAELAKLGYYNNVIFHRIVSDFMIQGGDPTGTGRGGSSIYGKNFEDEIHSDLKHSVQSQRFGLIRTSAILDLEIFWILDHLLKSSAGILSMANSGPNTNGSQFFITLSPCQWLDGKHSIFGRVNSGMHVVQRISKVPTDSNDRPLEDVKILKSYVKNSY